MKTAKNSGLGGDSLKIYLTLLCYGQSGVKTDENALANVLGIDISSVKAGMIELESKGLISREGSDLFIQNLTEKHIRDNYNPRTAPRPEAATGEDGGPDRTHLLRAISDRFFGGQMSQAWYGDIILWADRYGFCDEVVFMIFQQNRDKPLNRAYMKKVMEAYGERGIRTVEQMNSWLQKRETYVKIRARIASNLKLNPLSVYQEKYIEKWFYDYGYGFDIIDLALKEGAGMKNPSFNLYDTILTDWHSAGLDTAEAVKEHIGERRRAQQTKQNAGSEQNPGQKQNRNSRNYDQRKYDPGTYDSVYRRENDS